MAGDLPVDDDRLTAVGLLLEVARALGDRLGEQIAEHGLAPSEFEALLRLARSDSRRLRMADLAAQTALTASGLSRLVDRLVGRGLVARQACPEDGRGAFAALTGEGADLLAAVLPDHLSLIDELLIDVVPTEHAAGLDGALRAVRSLVAPGAEAGA